MKQIIAMIVLLVLLDLPIVGQVVQQNFKQGNSYIHSLVFSHDGNNLYSASLDGTIAKWNMRTRRRVGYLDLDAAKSKHRYTISQLYGMQFSPDDKTVAISYQQTSVVNEVLQNDTIYRTALLDAASVQIKTVLQNALSDMAFAPDGQTLITIGPEPKTRIWSVNESKEIRQFQIKDVGTPLFTSDGSKLIVASRIGWASKGPMVVVYDASSGRIVHEIPERHAQITGFAISPDDRNIAIGGFNGGIFTLKLWSLYDSDKIEPFNLLSEDSKLGYNVAFSSNGKLLASSGLLSCCQTIAVRRLSDNKIVKEFIVSSNVKSIAFSPNGMRLAFGTERGEIFIKNL